MGYASYLGSCNVAVQEISQVRKENISNEQKKNDYLHTQVFNGKFQMSLATWIGRMTGRFWQRKIWVSVGLDGQVRVKTREIENVFFFSLQGPLPLHCLEEILEIYIVQCCKRTRLAGRENIRGSWDHDLLLSNISSNLIPRVNSGTRLDFHFDHQKLMKT